MAQPLPRTSPWYQPPPADVIKPPLYPARPDLFEEVEWGPFPSCEDTKTAYLLWSLPDSVLAEERKEGHPFPRPYPEEDPSDQQRAMTLDVLALNVYESLMRNHRMPKADDDWDEQAQMKLAEDGRTKEGWSYEDIFGRRDMTTKIEVNNHDVLESRWWTIPRLRKELQRRRLDTAGKAIELRRRLYNDERQRLQIPVDMEGSFSRGIPRRENYTRRLAHGGHLNPLDMYTWAILLSPYNPAHWVSRSYLFYQMGYFDLALGDAYRAQLLCEILCNGHTRNRQPGLHPRVWHGIEQHILHIPREDFGELPPAVNKMRDINGPNYFVPTLRKALHNITSLSLKALQCWHDYDNMEHYLSQRLNMPHRDHQAFVKRYGLTKAYTQKWQDKRKDNETLFLYERQAGNIGGRSYPHGMQNVVRRRPEFLARLNQELISGNEHLPWKRCEVRCENEFRGELGVFATRDIRKGEIIYVDEPSMRGHLNIIRPADARYGRSTWPRCDNCNAEVPESARDLDSALKRRLREEQDRSRCACSLQWEPLVFCPATSENGQSCLEIARELYHHRACGKDWKWLHDAMRLNWNTHHAGRAEHPQYLTHNNEAHGTVLSLLLREVFDVTLQRRAKTGNDNLMAHELDELLPLAGEEQWTNDRFPFTLAANIKVPFDILSQLGVNIFRDLTFDTWVIQIVLRKLLLSAVPWDEDRRSDGDTMERESRNLKDLDGIEHQVNQMDKCEDTMERHEPSFHGLYVFPGLALFNHSCPQVNNAKWAFDSVVPNRVIVWAGKSISQNEEITIEYRHKQLSRNDARRLLGRDCECRQCRYVSSAATGPGTDDDDDDDDYGASTEEESQKRRKRRKFGTESRKKREKMKGRAAAKAAKEAGKVEE